MIVVRTHQKGTAMTQRSGRLAPMPVDVAPCTGEGVLSPVFILGVIIEAGVIVLTNPRPAQ